MIDLNKTHQVADIIHETIRYSGLECAIISSPIFNRLHHILQSSLVGLTYSSNKVKRFEHSLGVMHLAGEILYYSFNNTSDLAIIERCLEECTNEIKAWIKLIDFSREKSLKTHYADTINEDTIFSIELPDSSLYREYLPHTIKDSYKFSYYVLFEATRIAGLLHDIGHLPYSHIFEHATQQLYNMVKNVKSKNTAQIEFLDIMKPYCEMINHEKKELHEEIGINLVKQIKTEISEELSKNQQLVNLFVLAVFDFAIKILESNNSDDSIYGDVHRIIAGVFDADRLDYCSRDLFCAGVRKDIIPYQRVLSNYRMMFGAQPADEDKTRSHILFCPAIKNIVDIEDLLDRRWKIFSTMNYHHRVHKHEVIFSEILAQVGFNELQELKTELKPLEHGKPLPLSLLSIWQLVKKLRSNNSLIDYFIIQLDDGWMDTLLKNKFFKVYGKDYRNEEKYSEDSQWNKFDELISAKKRYFSVYKRSVDFHKFDIALEKSLTKNIHSKYLGDVIQLIAKINALNGDRDSELKLRTGALNANKILALFLPENTNLFFTKIENEINSFLKAEGKKLNIVDCMVRSCNFSLGFTEGAPIWLWEGDHIVRFEKVSVKRRTLDILKDACLPFHLYYLPYDSNKDVDITTLENKLVDIVTKEINNFAQDEINS